MFIYEAAELLKDVFCPHCKKGVRAAMDCPFRVFNALELNSQCTTKECVEFYRALNEHFNLLRSGEISEPEFREWLDVFKTQ